MKLSMDRLQPLFKKNFILFARRNVLMYINIREECIISSCARDISYKTNHSFSKPDHREKESKKEPRMKKI